MNQQSQSDKQLKASEERLKNLIEAAFEAIVIHQQGRIIDVNQQYLEMFGCTLDEVKQTDGMEMIAPQSRNCVKEKMASGYEGTYETFGIKKDGTIFPIEIRAKEISLDGQSARICAIRDLTGQLQQKEQLKAVFESSQDCIVVWDKDYNYLYANQTAIDHVHTTRDKVIGKNIRDGLAHIPDYMELWMKRIDKVFKTDKPMRVEDTLPVDNRIVHSESMLSPIRYPGGEMFAVGVVYRDITELKASEERFKLLADVSIEAVLIYRQNTVLDANQQFLDMFGYTLEEAKQINRLELIAPRSRELAKQLQDSEFLEPLEAFALKKDGTVFPAEVNHRKTVLDGQTVMIGTIRDMTQQKQEQQQLKAVFESSQDCIVVWDKDYNYLYANQTSINHVHTTRDKVIGKNICDGLAHIPDYMKLWMKRIDEVFKTGTPMRVEDSLLVDDRIVHSESMLSPICYPGGEMFAVGVVYRDITEQKKLQQQLHESEKNYRELYEKSPIALYRTRISDGKLLECNKALVELLGYDSKEEIQGLSTAADRYVDINDRAMCLERLRKDKRIESFQYLYKRKNGEHIWIEATAEIFPEQGFIEGAMRDITAAKCLSKTEEKVLDQLMKGKGNKQIARELGRSVRTIEYHRAHIFHKLGVDNLVDLTQKVLNLPNRHKED